MSEQKNSGCVMNVILLAILAVLVFSVFGGALALDGVTQRQVTIYPSGADIDPAPTPIVYAPVVVQAGSPDVVMPFVVEQTACSVPEGWRVGVSPLPDCWESLSREEQNEIIRSH